MSAASLTIARLLDRLLLIKPKASDIPAREYTLWSPSSGSSFLSAMPFLSFWIGLTRASSFFFQNVMPGLKLFNFDRKSPTWDKLFKFHAVAHTRSWQQLWQSTLWVGVWSPKQGPLEYPITSSQGMTGGFLKPIESHKLKMKSQIFCLPQIV